MCECAFLYYVSCRNCETREMLFQHFQLAPVHWYETCIIVLSFEHLIEIITITNWSRGYKIHQKHETHVISSCISGKIILSKKNISLDVTWSSRVDRVDKSIPPPPTPFLFSFLLRKSFQLNWLINYLEDFKGMRTLHILVNWQHSVITFFPPSSHLVQSFKH